MSKPTIKDLEARLQILENNTQSNKDRINKLEEQQGEVVDQRIALNKIQNQLEIMQTSQKETLEKMETIREKIEEMQLQSADINNIKINVKKNTEFKNKHSQILNTLYWIVGTIVVALIGAIINILI